MPNEGTADVPEDNEARNDAPADAGAGPLTPKTDEDPAAVPLLDDAGVDFCKAPMVELLSKDDEVRGRD